jgi:hypothetical protein
MHINMRLYIIMAIMMVCLVSTMTIAGDLLTQGEETKDTTITASNIFVALKNSNGTAKEATFTVDGTKLATTDTVGVYFVEYCGHVTNYTLKKMTTCYKNETLYNTETVNVCDKTVIDNKTMETKDYCYQKIQQGKSYNQIMAYECENLDKSITDLSDYKITNVTIKPGWCLINNTYYTYLIDWVPKVTTNTEVIDYKEWKIWNATGGTKTNYVDSGGVNWTVHKFTANGTFTANDQLANITILIVAGGGGGGYYSGGGGGAGGIVNYNLSTMNVGNYTIVIGTGGVAGATGTNTGGNGTNSSFNGTGISSRGGGGGRNGAIASVGPGATGGSGGGASSNGGSQFLGGLSTYPQGLNGGNSSGSYWYVGGGGGGAGTNGTYATNGNGAGDPGIAGWGGNGTTYGITGTNITYAGGGGGGAWGTVGGCPTCKFGNGGSGGGGNGSNTTTGMAGTINLGAGGGGGKDTSNGGAGGDGVIIIAYQTNTSITITFINTTPINKTYTNLTNPTFAGGCSGADTPNIMQLIINGTSVGANTSYAINGITNLTTNMTLTTSTEYIWWLNCSNTVDGTYYRSNNYTLYVTGTGGTGSCNLGCIVLGSGCFASASNNCTLISR